jgi:Glycosyltransferase family 87
MQPKKMLTVVLIASVCGLLFLVAFMATSVLPAQDLTQYWAAARLVRLNPYSFQSVAVLEKSAGVSVSGTPLVLKNPPWAIPFILPLRFFNYRVAFALWTVFSVVVVAGCVRAVWQRIEKSESLFSILLPILFGPTIVLLMLGQWTVLVLLGITGFLIMVERRRDWVAGAFLVLVMGKPHVALLFLLAIALWTLRFRRWAIFYSAVSALAATSLAMLAINPHIFIQFLGRTRQVVDETVLYPNLGGMLYMVTGHHVLALLPQIAGIVWLIFYWSFRWHDWNWMTDGMLVLVVSIASSYYSYPYDEILMLPALVTAYVLGNKRIFIVCFAAVNVGYGLYLSQVAGSIGFSYMFLWWTATGWLMTYYLSRRSQFIRIH